MPAPTSDAVLTHEREHLARARANLARMREATLALDASKASDAVSGEALGATLARRVAALTDEPEAVATTASVDCDLRPDRLDSPLCVASSEVLCPSLGP